MVFDLAVLGFDENHKPVADLYWIVGTDYTDAYREFELMYELNEELDNIEPGSLHVRDEGRDRCSFRTKAGQLVETITAADPTSIGRLEPFGIIGSEVSRWSPETWTRVYGRLARKYREGSWGIFSGSFETSQGPFADYFNIGQGPNELEIYSVSIPTWTNFHRYPGGLDNPEIKRQKEILSPHKFLERFGGRPAPPTNAVLPDFSTALHVDADIDYVESEPCYITVDPGDVVNAVLFYQIVDGEVWVIDEVYTSRWNYEAVIDEVKMRPGWKHAVRTRRGTIDIAGAQHHGRSSAKELWEERTGFIFGANKVAVEDSIERLQSVLTISSRTGRARLRIHPRCKGIISELGGGPSPVEHGGVWLRQSAGGRAKRENDHACKALAYGLYDLFGNAMPDGMRLPENINYETFEPVSYLSKWSFR